MVSRIDRLFILLDTGSNESIRLAAAKQLGEVGRIQPDDLNYLLHKIKQYSYKSVWETRVAAGHAIRCVLEHVGPWPKQELITQQEKDDIKFKSRQDKINELMNQGKDTDKIFQEFDIDKVISHCQKLLSLDLIETGKNSRGKGSSKSSQTKNDKEQLMRQRKLINKELGISMVDSLNLGVKSTDIVSNEDLVQNDDNDNKSFPSTSISLKKCIDSESMESKNIVMEFTQNEHNICNELRNEGIIIDDPFNPTFYSKRDCEIHYRGITDISHKIPKTTKYLWPLADFSHGYAKDLFDPSWEIRHGAAIALREIVKLQGKFAGRRTELSCEFNDILNQLWLIDMALTSVIVLALDKFGDFLFDQVVAPVRENVAQLLGCCVANMTEKNVNNTIKLILKLLDSSDWATRHGGILGLKYSLNIVDKELSKKLLLEYFEPIFTCLGDTVDDVSAEAAASLVPLKDLIIEVIPDKAPKLIKFLWEHLANLDELTTSTSNIVLLLASLITSSSAQLEPSEITQSIPRLWSLLSHSSTTVRVSVLKALLTLMKPQKSTCLSWMPEELSTTALRLIFQRSILENVDEVRPYLEDVWMHLIKINENPPESQLERFNLLKSTSQYLNYWLCLILQPTITPIDRGSPMWLNIRPDGTKSDIKPDGEVYIASSTFNAESINQQKYQVTKCRLLSTKLIGALYANLVNDFSDTQESQHSKDTLKYLADMFIHYMRTKSANQRIISGWALEFWASHQIKLVNNDNNILRTILPYNLIDQLNLAIQEINLCYDELASTFTRLQQETRDFVSTLKSANITLADFQSLPDKRAIYNLNQIQSLCDINIEVELNRISSKKTATNCDSKGFKNDSHDVTRSQIYTTLISKKMNLTKSLKSTQLSQKSLSASVLSSLACAHISWRIFPKSLNLIINPLMDSIEIEEEQPLQNKAIDYLVLLIDFLCEKPKENCEVIDNILKRLIDILSCKSLSMIFESNNSSLISEVPNSARCSIDAGIQSGIENNNLDSYRIILLDNLQRKAELSRATSRRQSSINTSISLKRSHSVTTPQELLTNNNDSTIQDESTKQQQSNDINMKFDIKLRGSSIALNKLVSTIGDKLPDKLGQFWDHITNDIKTQVNSHLKLESGFDQSSNDIKLIKSLRLLEVVGQSVHINLRKHLLELFDDLILLLTSQNSIIRHHSAHCIGVISKMMFDETIELIYKKIVPMLELSNNTLARCGSIETIALIIEYLQLELVPKIDMFIINVLRRMSDQNDQVRLMATHCFGKLLSLMPLNLEKNRISNENTNVNINIKHEPSNSSINLNEQYDEQKFIEQLLNPKKLDNFEVPFHMPTGLRSYQQDGLNWLAFLNRFNLHGILCDEMGLGKTFMTICMVAADHFIETQKNEQKESSDNLLTNTCPPSLIVCPSTLTEHWLYEIDKFLPDNLKIALCPIAYSGTLNDRMNFRSRISFDKQILSGSGSNLTNNSISSSKKKINNKRINLVVTSYDIVRNDIDFFKEMHWNYCVLDEGHIIKNGKTKLSGAIRLLNAKHRLILTGTPIQNNVTELWSLFDFLMPGFLGSERQFNVKYTKPILQSRELKCSSRELEAGALAMESLHRQVLPFILRRLKEEVLDDLPPKIIQDYYCELSQLQHKLYEDFTKSKLCNNVTKKSIKQLNDKNDDIDNDSAEATIQSKSSKTHVFQALQYLKNVCNHPKLVLTEKHSQYNEIKKHLELEKTNLDDINHSSKLKALKQLLIDCGIGVSSVNQSNDLDQTTSNQQQVTAANLMSLQSVVNQHRALIFCQVKSMVDIIENDLLKKHLPSVTYLRLDGSVKLYMRQSIVSRFNNDPSIDILLLTTQIGGLGLNLTGADTVIFVEHDWNPTKDLQAMDRAHRIGQKKVVNVYRLITKGTLEEKIMGLQKFKTMVSNTVINQDNTGLGTMNVDQLLDLFEDSASGDAGNGNQTSNNSNISGGGSTSKSFIDLLPELWDQQQYETEYDLSSFVSSLKN